MRVCLLTDHYRPGPSSGARLMSELVDGLREGGHEVGVITARRRGAAREDGVERVPLVFARARNVATRLVGEAAFSMWAALKLLVLRRRYDHALILASPPLLPLFAGPAARLAGLPYSVILMDLYPDMAVALGKMSPTSPLRGLWRRWLTAVLERAAGALVLGACMKRRVEALSPRIRVRVAPNWVDGRDVVTLDPADNDWLAAEPGLGGRFVVQYAGNLGRAQDFGPILDAAEALRADPDVRFVFVGDGVERPAVEAEAGRRGLDTVLFRPPEPYARQSAFLGAADVCLITLKPGVEGLAVPSKFYPIVAAGKPVIALLPPDSEVGAAVLAHDLGAVLDGPARGDLARAVADLKADPARFGRERIRAVFEAEFDRPVAIARYLAYLADLEETP